MEEATHFNNQLSVEMNEQQFTQLQQLGTMQIHIQTEEERAAWRKALQPVYKQFAPSIGEELMAEVKRLHQGR
jgi:C4-dicarboxylate-binding protein DctP